MRSLSLVAVLALSGCSLIRARYPDPPPRTEVPRCVPNYGITVADVAMAAAGAVGAGFGTYLVAARPVAADGTSNVPTGAVMITSGIGVAALFGFSAGFGVPRIGACSEAMAEFTRDHPDTPTDALARQELRCPVDALSFRELDFGRDDPSRESHPWARQAVMGCGRVTWCGEDEGRHRCGQPADFTFASRQLAVETGCPAQQIQQIEFFGTNLQSTYRLDACGTQYSCVVPLVRVTEKSAWTGGRVERDSAAGSSFGSQLTCKPVLVPPPPSPPSQP